MENLSVEELRTRMNALNSTVVTLQLALADVNCEKTKKILLAQIRTYNESIKQILLELSKRKARH